MENPTCDMAEEKARTYAQNAEKNVDASAYCANYGAHKPGMKKEEVSDYYSKWAPHYEEDLCLERYRGPIICLDAIFECFPVSHEDKDQVKILDVACGTGYLGKMLKERGFSNVDGLDPADGMLKIAEKKDCYKKLYCEYMQSDVPIDKGTYDCAAIAGGMGEGHIPCHALYGMAHVVKPGGYVIIVMRREYLEHVEEYRNRLEPLMQKMQDDGLWVLESKKFAPRYSFNNEGVVFKFKVC